jgi:hypothetical protein
MPDAHGHETHREWFEKYMAKLDRELPPGEQGRDRVGCDGETLRHAQGGPSRDRDLPQLIRDAWEHVVKPKLKNDTDELNRRLARRRNGMMNRPPRAWCLAIRASDHRLNPGTAAMVPQSAAYPRDSVGNVEHEYGPHDVMITAPLVRRLCMPHYVGSGQDQAELARDLGCFQDRLLRLRKMGGFDSVRKIKLLAGKRGKDVPVLFTGRALDPGAKGLQYADPVWGTLNRYAAEHVPDDLHQTLQRVPSRIHFDYRPRLRRGYEGTRFIGWRWVCPACRRTCRTIYYPLPPLSWVQLLEREFHDSDRAHPDALSPFNNTFACVRCHNVLYHSSISPDAWNHLIAHLSAGLLYGSEVAMPSWYVRKRKKPFKAMINREPSKRREQILPMLLAGIGVTKIARELRVTKSTAGSHTHRIYRQHNVHSQKELMELYERWNGERVAA